MFTNIAVMTSLLDGWLICVCVFMEELKYVCLLFVDDCGVGY